MGGRIKNIPEKFKGNNGVSYVRLVNEDDEVHILTEQETRSIIKEMIYKEIDFHSSEVIEKFKEKSEENLSAGFWHVDEELNKFINRKFDALSDKIVDMLITRKFNEEVEKRVNEKLKQKGKF